MGEGLCEGAVVGLGDGSGVGESDGDAEGEGVGESVGLGDSCAAAGCITGHKQSSTTKTRAPSFPPRTVPQPIDAP